MLSRLEMERFRAFRRLTLEGLTGVNLLVGRNGCGKTSVLEAVGLVAAGGHPYGVAQVISQRMGHWVLPEGAIPGEWSVHSLFQNGVPGAEMSLELRAQRGDEPIEWRWSVERLPTAALKEERLRGRELRFRPAADSSAGARERLVLIGSGSASEPIVALEFNLKGRLSTQQLLTLERGLAAVMNCGLVPCSGIQERTLGQWFSAMALTDAEDRVLEMLRILRPDLRRLAWLPESEGVTEGFYLTLADRKDRVPLDLLGEGMRRLLGIAVRAADLQGGVLLIDEIDTGLHYTVLEQLWRALIDLSRRFNIQIFATTHSGDCVRSLAWLVEDDPSVGSAVSLHRIEPGLETSVRYGAEEIALAAKHHIEVRG